jgi:hypothetical protein
MCPCYPTQDWGVKRSALQLDRMFESVTLPRFVSLSQVDVMYQPNHLTDDKQNTCDGPYYFIAPHLTTSLKENHQNDDNH